MKTVTKIEANQRTTGSEKKLRVAAYCRVSTGSDDQLESLAEQKKHYETYIQAHENWYFAGLYYDEGISGTMLTMVSPVLTPKSVRNSTV